MSSGSRWAPPASGPAPTAVGGGGLPLGPRPCPALGPLRAGCRGLGGRGRPHRSCLHAADGHQQVRQPVGHDGLRHEKASVRPQEPHPAAHGPLDHQPPDGHQQVRQPGGAPAALRSPPCPVDVAAPHGGSHPGSLSCRSACPFSVPAPACCLLLGKLPPGSGPHFPSEERPGARPTPAASAPGMRSPLARRRIRRTVSELSHTRGAWAPTWGASCRQGEPDADARRFPGRGSLVVGINSAQGQKREGVPAGRGGSQSGQRRSRLGQRQLGMGGRGPVLLGLPPPPFSSPEALPSCPGGHDGSGDPAAYLRHQAGDRQV